MALEWMYPIDKTNLDVLRFVHFLSLAVVDGPIHSARLAGAEEADGCGRPSSAASIRSKSFASACSWRLQPISP